MVAKAGQLLVVLVKAGLALGQRSSGRKTYKQRASAVDLFGSDGNRQGTDMMFPQSRHSVSGFYFYFLFFLLISMPARKSGLSLQKKNCVALQYS